MQTKILIIKLGYSETLDPEIGSVPSLGDVFRTTPILWALKEKHPESTITWLVSKHAEPLLRGNPLIDRLLVWDEFVPFQLMREKFDLLINLEKIHGVAALADMIDAWNRYGFRFESKAGSYSTYEHGFGFLPYIDNKRNGSIVGDYWQKVLVEMIGVEWKGQEYILGYEPKSMDRYDIGLNYKVGNKWPLKAMPMEKWKSLAIQLEQAGYRVSWQQGLADLEQYIDWLASCRMIITHDSLGLHLALAMGKRIIGLFGPTDPQEIYFYHDSQVIMTTEKCTAMPCYTTNKCITGKECMNKIDLPRILETVHAICPKEELKYAVG